MSHWRWAVSHQKQFNVATASDENQLHCFRSVHFCERVSSKLVQPRLEVTIRVHDEARLHGLLMTQRE